MCPWRKMLHIQIGAFCPQDRVRKMWSKKTQNGFVVVAERTIEFLEGNAVVVKYFMQENIFVVAEILKQIQRTINAVEAS